MEKYNPDLEFIKSENSNIETKCQKYTSSTHTGLATYDTVLSEILSHCILDMSIGAEDCNANFFQNDENMIVNILMHKIGHVLGLGHTSKANHLIHPTESPQISFNTKGCDVPKRFEGLYPGQKLLITQETEI